jgi:predicted transcriptional regulator
METPMRSKKRGRKAMRLAVGEIEMLEVLWREKAVTISEAQAALPRPAGYTTVQTRLNRLVAKGIATKTATRPARYEPAIAPEDVSRDDLDVLVKRVHGGQVVPLVAHLVRDRSLSVREIEELRELIDEAEQRGKGKESGQ